MLKKLLGIAFAVMLGVQCGVFATDVSVADPAAVDGSGGGVVDYWWASLATGQERGGIDVSITSGATAGYNAGVIVGMKSDETTLSPAIVNMTIGDLTIDGTAGNGAYLYLGVKSDGATGLGNQAITLTTGDLSITKGIVKFGSTAGQSPVLKLDVDSFTFNSGTFDMRPLTGTAKSVFVARGEASIGDGGATNATFTATGNGATFQNGLTVNKGGILEGDNITAANATTTVNFAGASGTKVLELAGGLIRVGSGGAADNTLLFNGLETIDVTDYKDTLGAIVAGNSLIDGSLGNINASSAIVNVDVDTAGVGNTFTIDSTAAANNYKATFGELNAYSGDTYLKSGATPLTTGAIIFSNASTVGGGENDAKIKVVGVNNQFNGGLTVYENGTLTDGGAAGTAIMGGTAKTLTLSGGTVEDNVGLQVVANKVVVAAGSTGSQVNNNAGALTFVTTAGGATKSDLEVAGDLGTDTTGGAITFNKLTQTNGDIVGVGSVNALTFEKASEATGGTFAAENAMFTNGMTFKSGSTLTSNGVYGQPNTTLISTGDGKKIVMESGSILDISNGDVGLGTAKTNMDVKGTITVGAYNDGAAYDNFYQLVGWIGAGPVASTINVSGARFVADDPASLLNTVAWDETAANDGNASVIINAGGSGTKVEGFTGAYMDYGTYGEYTLAQVQAGDADLIASGMNVGDVYVASIDNRSQFNGLPEDYAGFRTHLRNIYPDAYTNTKYLPDNIYVAALTDVNGEGKIVNGFETFTYDRDNDGFLTPAAQYWQNNLLAIAQGGVSTRDQSVTGAMVASYLPGSLFAVQDVARNISNTMGTHNNQLRHLRNEIGNMSLGTGGALPMAAVVSDAAVYDAAAYIDQVLKNRFWVGGLGFWEDADTRNGIKGYKYDGAGFITGYDRMFGPMTIGGAFAYTKGDYEDKAALSHDSDIKNYSFELYTTYHHCSGFWGTLYGGYTRSDFDIKEKRNGYYFDGDWYPEAGWQKASYDSDTWDVGLQLGFDIRPVSNFRLTPSIGIGYITTKADGHKNYWDGIAISRVSGTKLDTGYLPIKLDGAYDIQIGCESKLSLNGNIGYTYNFSDSNVGGSIAMNGILDGQLPLSVLNRTEGHSLFNVGAGFRFTYRNFDIGANYDYFRKSDVNAHRVYGTLGLSF